MIDARIERFRKTSPLEISALTIRGAKFTTVRFAGQEADHLETSDFDTKDPWSEIMRQEIGKRRLAGWFKGQKVLEFGSGDGRNFREAGMDVPSVVGVEKEEWRSAAAWHNLVNIERRSPTTVKFWTGCAVDYLTSLKDRGEKVGGRALACLPQSPEGENTADKDENSPSTEEYRAEWGKAGLALNAAVLDNLHKVATADLRALFIISDRVLPDDQRAVFNKTGWEVVAESRTVQRPVQQDPDTGIAYVQAYDDGERFWERANGIFRPLDAKTAEERRVKSLGSLHPRKNLNVYHDLTVFEIKPRR